MATKYRPRLIGYSTPAYCAEGKWVITHDGDGIATVHYVERVVRAWRKEAGHHVEPLGDGSRRAFAPEAPGTNGRNPCLLYVQGEPHPWYFDSGHTSVLVMSQDHRSDD